MTGLGLRTIVIVEKRVAGIWVLLARQWALRMLTHSGASSHHGSGARRYRIRTADQSRLHGPAPERLHYRAGRGAGAHRTQMTGWSNVVRVVISKVLPTF
jgi:hypothetical protein